MFVSAFNQQVGVDARGGFVIGRLPLPTGRWPWPRATATPAEERGFLVRYRAFLVDELADVQHRVASLQESSGH